MGSEQFEQMVAELLKADFSTGTEAFRDALLARCLAALDSGACDDVGELDDVDLELLAAAGDPLPVDRRAFHADNGLDG